MSSSVEFLGDPAPVRPGGLWGGAGFGPGHFLCRHHSGQGPVGRWVKHFAGRVDHGLHVWGCGDSSGGPALGAGNSVDRVGHSRGFLFLYSLLMMQGAGGGEGCSVPSRLSVSFCLFVCCWPSGSRSNRPFRPACLAFFWPMRSLFRSCFRSRSRTWSRTQDRCRCPLFCFCSSCPSGPVRCWPGVSGRIG